MKATDPHLVEEDARVVEALRFAGVHVSSIYDLVNTSKTYATAIPVLAKLLSQVRHPRIREGIARALAVKEASAAVPDLIEEFKRLRPATYPEQSAKWAIGNAIAVTATDTHIPEVIAIMSDKSHGLARYMLPLALLNARFNRELAAEALMRALDDDETAMKAMEALAKMRVTEAAPRILRLTGHSNADIRKAAAKALKKLEL